MIPSMGIDIWGGDEHLSLHSCTDQGEYSLGVTAAIFTCSVVENPD
jgi:hypothetical protein